MTSITKDPLKYIIVTIPNYIPTFGLIEETYSIIEIEIINGIEMNLLKTKN